MTMTLYSPDNSSQNFVPWMGRAWMDSFESNRGLARHRLQSAVDGTVDGTSGRYGLAWLDELSRQAHRFEFFPAPGHGLREAMATVHAEWSQQQATSESAASGATLQAIIAPLVRQGSGMVGVDGATRWAIATIRGLGLRFDATGQLSEFHDRELRPLGGDERNRPMDLLHLALGTAWLAWSDAEHDADSSRAGLNRLLKICDFLSTALIHSDWIPTGQSALWLAAAFELEEALLRAWAERSDQRMSQ